MLLTLHIYRYLLFTVGEVSRDKKTTRLYFFNELPDKVAIFLAMVEL